MRVFLQTLHVLSAAPLFLAGALGVTCIAIAVHYAGDVGILLIFIGLALLVTLLYPGLVEFQLRIFRDPLGLLPFYVYDAFFVAGELFTLWRVRGVHGAWWILGAAVVLWIIGGAAARRRVADLQTGAVPR